MICSSNQDPNSGSSADPGPGPRSAPVGAPGAASVAGHAVSRAVGPVAPAPPLPQRKQNISEGFANPWGDNLCYRNAALLALLHTPAFRTWAMGTHLRHNPLNPHHPACKGPSIPLDYTQAPDENKNGCLLCNIYTLFTWYHAGNRDKDCYIYRQVEGTSVAVKGFHNWAMDALWRRYRRTKDGKWARLGSQQDVFELLERLIKALHRLIQHLPADPVPGSDMGQPMGLFVSKIQDLEQCKNCLRSRNLGAADYYMYVGLPLPPRATFVPKFQDMINWAWNQDIVSDNICECDAVGKKAVRRRRLELAPEVLLFQIERTVRNRKSLRAFKLEDEFEIPSSVLPEGQNPIKYNVKAVIFHQGPSLTAGHYTVGVKEFGTRRWAFLDDDKPPATYNNLWKLVSSKQQCDSNAFQVYAVIAEKDKGEKKEPLSMPVSENNVANLLSLHRFEVDLQVQARHAELGWLSGRARVPLQPGQLRNSQSLAKEKRKLEQELSETRRELYGLKRQKPAEQAPATEQTNTSNSTNSGTNASTGNSGIGNITSNAMGNTTNNGTDNTAVTTSNATSTTTSNSTDNIPSGGNDGNDGTNGTKGNNGKNDREDSGKHGRSEREGSKNGLDALFGLDKPTPLSSGVGQSLNGSPEGAHSPPSFLHSPNRST
ncbi:hypothetical protein BDW66DRAFT_153210 [Aspergillus desertorum]